MVFYIHPREIDPDHPRLPMHLARRFKTYVNIKSTQEKVRRLLDDFECITFANYLQISLNLSGKMTEGGKG